MKNDGGPAFPRSYSERKDPDGTYWDGGVPGMSLRDWFAGMALQGYCSHPNIDNEQDDMGLAVCCYNRADALLKEGEKE